MSNAMITAVRKVPLKPSAKLVMLVLADAHNSRTGQCNMSIPSIAKATGLAARSVIRILDSLEGRHVTIHRSTGEGNRYELHPSTSDTASPVNQCHHVTSDDLSPVTSTTGTSDIDDIAIYKEPNEPIHSSENSGELFELEEPKKPARKLKSNPKPETTADPRFHSITSRIGEVCKSVTGKAFSFNGRFANALQKFLKGWKGSADEWLEMYADALALSVRPFAKYTVAACDPAALCHQWNAVAAEVDKLKADEAREQKSVRKPAFTKTI